MAPPLHGKYKLFIELILKREEEEAVKLIG
jgi:hypothetical protein